MPAPPPHLPPTYHSPHIVSSERQQVGSLPVAYTPSDAELQSARILREEVTGHVLYKSGGCPACLNTGYKGRTGIYELLIVTDGIREVATQSAAVIKKRAVEEGMKTLRDDGVRKIREGLTSIDEVMRVVTTEGLAEA